jgi:hypothetical protein
VYGTRYTRDPTSSTGSYTGNCNCNPVPTYHVTRSAVAVAAQARWHVYTCQRHLQRGRTGSSGVCSCCRQRPSAGFYVLNLHIYVGNKLEITMQLNFAAEEKNIKQAVTKTVVNAALNNTGVCTRSALHPLVTH